MHHMIFSIACRSTVWSWLETNADLERFRWLRAAAQVLDNQDIVNEHKQIRRAIAGRDPIEASFLVSKHLHMMFRNQTEVLDQFPSTSRPASSANLPKRDRFILAGLSGQMQKARLRLDAGLSLNLERRNQLLYRDALGQVTGLVDVATSQDGHLASEQLQRDARRDGAEHVADYRHADDAVGDLVDLLVALGGSDDDTGAARLTSMRFDTVLS